MNFYYEGIFGRRELALDCRLQQLDLVLGRAERDLVVEVLEPRGVLRQAVRTWKNVFLLVLLAIALISLVAGLNCDAATDDAGACATLLSAFTARQLTYAGAALTFGFCCCPCFRLDCDADELRKRSCFLQAVERRRRERARQARLGRGDDGGAAAPDVEEGHELINRRPGGGG